MRESYPVTGRYIYIRKDGTDVTCGHLYEVLVFDESDQQISIVAGEMSGTYHTSYVEKCFNGDITASSGICHTNCATSWWLRFDLGARKLVSKILLYNRADITSRFDGAVVSLRDEPDGVNNWEYSPPGASPVIMNIVVVAENSPPDMLVAQLIVTPVTTFASKQNFPIAASAKIDIIAPDDNTFSSFQYLDTTFVAPNVAFGKEHSPRGGRIAVEIQLQRTAPHLSSLIELYIDDIVLQLDDGHGGASGRRCNYNLNFQGKEIVLDGGNADTTTIDCGLTTASASDYEPRRAASFLSGETSATKLANVTIQGCQAIFHGNSRSTNYLRHAGLDKTGTTYSGNNHGGAVLILNSGPTLSNLNILNPRAGYGGGIGITSTKDEQNVFFPIKRTVLNNVIVSGAKAAVSGGALRSYYGCFDWVSGSVTSSTAPQGGSAAYLHLNKACGGRSNSIQDVKFLHNQNTRSTASEVRHTSCSCCIRFYFFLLSSFSFAFLTFFSLFFYYCFIIFF